MKKKTSYPRSSRPGVPLRPGQTSQPKAVAVAVPNIAKPPHLLPPLERALNQFGQELRKELTRAQDQIKALQTELAEFRALYSTHTHSYTRTVTGSGGNLWLSLGHLKHYIDEDKENFDKWGVYFRENGSTGSAPEVLTGPPNA